MTPTVAANATIARAIPRVVAPVRPLTKAQWLMAHRMSEKALLAHVRGAARQLGWKTYHTHRSDRSEPGFPDLCMVRKEQLIFVELKIQNESHGKLTDEQTEWAMALAECVPVLLWRPEQWLDGTVEHVLLAERTAR